MNVFVETCPDYSTENINSVLERWEALFSSGVRPGDLVVIKPNWIAHSHKYNETEWQSVVTHPALITGVLRKVLKCLKGRGKVVLTDGPQTQASWLKIMSRMTPNHWVEMGQNEGVEVQIIDLREDEWIAEDDVNVLRRKLPGDPLGSTECDLSCNSEFINDQPSRRGYYGADYDTHDTNSAHSNGHHKYRVSRTAVTSDVFINLPKLKTHKKAGITCSLKNLVGINTYKNWLPHHKEGTPDEGGDQFPVSTFKSKAETMLLEKFKSLLVQFPRMGKSLIPVKKLGKRFFGETQHTIRNGSWYGNHTIWRMILDLNKILLYADADGKFRQPSPNATKRYISIVDGIVAGEGNGPEAPDPVKAGILIAGSNPVAVDCVCAKLMGFDWTKIPAIANSFLVQLLPICNFRYDDIKIISSDPRFNKALEQISLNDTFRFRPHFGWKGHIEL
jgi:uncharacterized protein (DUF362 family)